MAKGMSWDIARMAGLPRRPFAAIGADISQYHLHQQLRRLRRPLPVHETSTQSTENYKTPSPTVMVGIFLH